MTLAVLRPRLLPDDGADQTGTQPSRRNPPGPRIGRIDGPPDGREDRLRSGWGVGVPDEVQAVECAGGEWARPVPVEVQKGSLSVTPEPPIVA